LPNCNGKRAEKTKGRSLNVLNAIKKSLVVVKAAFLCLAHALIIAMALVNGDPKYKSYREGYGLTKPVEDLLEASGVDLSNGGGLEELQQFQSISRTTKLLCLMVLNLIGLFLAEIPFRLRNCIYYTIQTLGTIT
jgi:hypothetical protein